MGLADSARPLTTMRVPPEADTLRSMAKHVLIIGAGVIGLSAAYYAMHRGCRVTVIDRNPDAGDGCSFGNAGMIVPSHFVPLAAPGMVKLGLKWMWNPRSPFYIKPRLSWDLLAWAARFWKASTKQHVERAAPLLRDLSFASRSQYESLADAWGEDFGLVRNGLVMLCKTKHTLDEESHFADKANQLGVPAQVLDAAATAKLDPKVTMDVAGGVYFPRDCHLSPHRFMSGLHTRLTSAGAAIVWNAQVTGFDVRDRRVHAVRTSSGQFDADEVVIAGGSWSPLIGRMLSLSLPMQAGKGYSLTLAQPRELPAICSIFTEARIAVTPMGSSLRFGGTMEIAGLDESITAERVQGIIESVPRYYPKFQSADFTGIQPWRGLRPCTPDGLPYLGRPARYDNVVIATGHAMMGLSLAPVTGTIVADLLTGAKPAFDLGLLKPDRYG